MKLLVEKRASWEPANTAAYGLAGLLLGLLLSVGLGALTPAGARGVLAALLEVATTPSLWPTLAPYLAPVALSAAGLALAYRARFITIGSEGQVILGMVAGYAVLGVALRESGCWPPAAVALALLLAALLGAGHGALVAALRVWAGANETLTSLMLNYVSVALVNYLVAGPWQYGGFTRSMPLPERYWLGAAPVAALAAAGALLVELVHRYTKLGVAADALGLARRAAETYGISYAATIVLVSALSGSLASIGGALYLASSVRQLQSIKQALGYGYMGVLAAWLAGLSPLGSLAASALIVLLYGMAVSLQLYGVPASAVLAMEALIVISVVLMMALSRYRVRIFAGS